jgi:hypothetical protein
MTVPTSSGIVLAAGYMLEVVQFYSFLLFAKRLSYLN